MSDEDNNGSLPIVDSINLAFEAIKIGNSIQEFAYPVLKQSFFDLSSIAGNVKFTAVPQVL